MNEDKDDLTLRSKIEQIANDPNQKRELVKKALFGEVHQTQLSTNYSETKTHKDRSNFKRVKARNIVNKYKLWRFKNRGITFKTIDHNKSKQVAKNKKWQIQTVIEKFYEDDSNSRQVAGIKERKETET